MVVEILHVTTPLLAFFLNIVFQLVGIRYLPTMDYFHSVAFGFWIGLFVVLIMEIVFIQLGVKLMADTIALCITNLVVYLFVSFSYFAFINLGVSSLRVRLLDELDQSEGGLSMTEILNRYGSREIVENRVEKLERVGQIILKNDKYFIGQGTALLMVKVLEALRFIVLSQKPRITFFK